MNRSIYFSEAKRRTLWQRHVENTSNRCRVHATQMFTGCSISLLNRYIHSCCMHGYGSGYGHGCMHGQVTSAWPQPQSVKTKTSNMGLVHLQYTDIYPPIYHENNPIIKLILLLLQGILVAGPCLHCAYKICSIMDLATKPDLRTVTVRLYSEKHCTYFCRPSTWGNCLSVQYTVARMTKGTDSYCP